MFSAFSSWMYPQGILGKLHRLLTTGLLVLALLRFQLESLVWEIMQYYFSLSLSLSLSLHRPLQAFWTSLTEPILD